MKNTKKLRSPAVFINPHICPKCQGDLEFYRERSTVERYHLNHDGTYEEGDPDIIDEYTSLICSKCDSAFPVYITFDEHYRPTYSISEYTSELINDKKIKEQTKDKPITIIEDPFYN